MPVLHPALLSVLLRDEIPADLRIDDAIVSSAIDHLVAPLLHEAAIVHELDGEADAMQRLAMHRLRSESQYKRATAALHVFLERVGPEIKVGVFKGLVLGPMLYDPPSLRWSTDVDVFFHPADLGQFGPALARAFVDQPTTRLPDFDAPPLDAIEIERMTRAASSVNQFNETRTLDDVFFDVHTDITKFGGRALGQQDLAWHRFSEVETGGYFVPDVELAMILCVVHSARDGFADLRKLVDFHRLVILEPDWDFVAEFVKTEGWTRAFSIALEIMGRYLGVALPPQFAVTAMQRSIGERIWPAHLRLLGSSAPMPVLRSVWISTLHQAPVGATFAAMHKLLVPLAMRKRSTTQARLSYGSAVLWYWLSRLAAPFRYAQINRSHRRRGSNGKVFTKSDLDV